MINKNDYFLGTDVKFDPATHTHTSVGGAWSASKDGDFDTLKVQGVDIYDFMKTVKDRFLILQPDFEKHEKYPALKDAYEQYKMIEALYGDEE